jgi:predicted acylesterase/phospholipase RssA
MAMALADRGIVLDLIVVTADAISGKEVLITEGNVVDAVTASAG